MMTTTTTDAMDGEKMTEPKKSKKPSGQLSHIREYQSYYGSQLEPEKKGFDLIRDGDPEIAAGIWQSETSTILDAMTLKGLFFSEDWVYICCDRMASKISSQWLRVMREETVAGKKVVKPDEAHPLQKLFESPNSHQDYHSWMYSMVVDLCILGNAIQYYAPAMGQMIPIPAERVRLVFDRTGQPEAYEVVQVQQDAMPIVQKGTRIPLSQICHVRRPNPSSLMWGLSPFLAGRPSILFSKYSKEWLNNFYIKGAQPGLVLEMTEDANEKALLRLMKSFETAYHGRRGQRRTLVLPKGIKATPITHSLADQQLKDYVAQNRETILAILGVPKHAVSLAETGSLGSEEYKQAMKDLWAGPLKSMMRMIAGALTKHFKNDLGPGRFLEFDLTDVDVLQEDQATKADLSTKLLTTHTLNEVRKMLYDLPPLPEGDKTPGAVQPFTFGAPAPMPPLPAKEAVPENLLDAVVPETTGAKPSKTREAIHAIIKANPPWWQKRNEILDAASKPAQEKLTEALGKIFEKKAALALEALKKSKRKSIKAPNEGPISLTQFKKNLKKAFDGLEDQYIEDAMGELLDVAQAGYGSQLVLPINLPSLDRIDALRLQNAEGRRLILEARQLDSFKSVSATSQDNVMARTENVMRQIESGTSANQTLQEIAQTITEYFTEVTPSRAMMIARTEVLTAASLGQAAAMEDAAEAMPDDQMMKVWVNAGDDLVRGNPGGKYPDSPSDHWGVASEDAIPYDKAFSNGLQFPRDPDGDPGETIQCRCGFISFPASAASALNLDLQSEPDPWTETAT